MGHSRPDTTQAYIDDLDLDDLAHVLALVGENRHAQASSDSDTESDEAREGLGSLVYGGGGFGKRENPRRCLHQHGACNPNATVDVATPRGLSSCRALDDRRRFAGGWERLLLCHSQK